MVGSTIFVFVVVIVSTCFVFDVAVDIFHVFAAHVVICIIVIKVVVVLILVVWLLLLMVLLRVHTSSVIIIILIPINVFYVKLSN